MNHTAVIGISILVAFFLVNAGLIAHQFIVVSNLETKLSDLEGRRANLLQGNIFLAQKRNTLKKEQGVLEQEITDLQFQNAELEDIRYQVTGGQEGMALVLKGTSQENRFLSVSIPGNGESLCLGDVYDIQWEGQNIKYVDISLLEGGFAYRIAEYYPGDEAGEDEEIVTGTYAWNIGELKKGVAPAGENYSIRITSFDYGSEIFSESELFTITQCNR